MYKVGGIELTGTEYGLLEALVNERDASGDCRPLARRLLKLDRNLGLFSDKDESRVFIALMAKGLVTGKESSGFFFFGDLTYLGIDFVREHRAAVQEAARKTRSDRLHDYSVQTWGAVSGGVVGLFTGAIGGWLFQLIP